MPNEKKYVIRNLQIRPFLSANVAASVLFFLAVVMGYLCLSQITSVKSAGVSEPHGNNFWPAFGAILSQNLGACLLLFSGLLTFGLSTLLAISFVGIFVGATAKIGVEAIGIVNLLTNTFLYIPFEFSAIIFSGAAGILPAIGQINNAVLKRQKLSYFRMIPHALKLQGVAVACLFVGAIIETLLIVYR